MQGSGRSDLVRRTIFVALGCACLVLAAIGIVLPGMPATVFVLAASYLFARSSTRLERWLVEHRQFGPYVQMARQRSMPWRAKLVSIVLMWAGVALACRLTAATSVALAVLACLLGAIGTGVLLFWVRSAPLARADRAA